MSMYECSYKESRWEESAAGNEWAHEGHTTSFYQSTACQQLCQFYYVNREGSKHLVI